MHRHPGGPAQDAGDHALVMRIEMKHDQKGHPRVGRKAFEQAAQRLDASRRRTHAHHGKR